MLTAVLIFPVDKLIHVHRNCTSHLFHAIMSFHNYFQLELGRYELGYNCDAITLILLTSDSHASRRALFQTRQEAKSQLSSLPDSTKANKSLGKLGLKETIWTRSIFLPTEVLVELFRTALISSTL